MRVTTSGSLSTTAADTSTYNGAVTSMSPEILPLFGNGIRWLSTAPANSGVVALEDGDVTRSAFFPSTTVKPVERKLDSGTSATFIGVSTTGFVSSTSTFLESLGDRKCEINSTVSVSGLSTLCGTSVPSTDVATDMLFADDGEDDFIIALPAVVIIGTLVSIAIIAIVIGNAFVVSSVIVYREMRTLTNWMIVSLATADILVAIGVLPLSAYQVS